MFPVENVSTTDEILRKISTQVISASINIEGAEVKDLPEGSKIELMFFSFEVNILCKGYEINTIKTDSYV